MHAVGTWGRKPDDPLVLFIFKGNAIETLFPSGSKFSSAEVAIARIGNGLRCARVNPQIDFGFERSVSKLRIAFTELTSNELGFGETVTLHASITVGSLN